MFDALLVPTLRDEAGTGLNDEGCGVLCAILSGLSIAPADQVDTPTDGSSCFLPLTSPR